MMSIDAYNENLRAQDAARSFRRRQPTGLAGYQARKKAQENDAIAPFAIVKEYYEYCITFEGQGSSIHRYSTKREALMVAQELKRRYDERNSANM